MKRLLTMSCCLQVGSKGVGQGQLCMPRTVRVDADGIIAVADCGNHRVSFYDFMI